MSMFKSVLKTGEKDALRKKVKELEEKLLLEEEKNRELEQLRKEVEKMKLETEIAKGEVDEVQAKCEGMSVRTAVVVAERDKLKAQVLQLQKTAETKTQLNSLSHKSSTGQPKGPLTSCLLKEGKYSSPNDRPPTVGFCHIYQLFELPEDECEEEEEEEPDTVDDNERNIFLDLRGSHSELRGSSVNRDGASLRWESDSQNFTHITVISDLDGTLLPPPHKNDQGKLVHPKIGDGTALAPLAKLLDNGGSVVGVTGGKLGLQQERFWDELPLKARVEGRVLLFCETGMVLYRSDNDGNPVEDESYGPFPGNTKRFLSQETVTELIKAIQLGMRQWFTDLKAQPDLIDAKHWLHAKCDQWSQEDAPVTNDIHITPRIELRGTEETGIFGLVVAGVPVEYGNKYLSEYIAPFKDQVDGLPTGRLCYDIVVPGLNKHLVLKYLLRCGLIARGAAISIADSPAGNDEGLTVLHDNGIPFISVAKSLEACPEHLRDCHVGGNHDGSGAFFQHLVKADEERSLTCDPLTIQKVGRMATRARKDLEALKK